MKSHPLSLVFWLVGFAACAAGNGGGGGSGGEGGTDEAGGNGDGGVTFTTNDTSSATTAMTGCPSDCSTVVFTQCEEVVCNEDTHECEVHPLEDDEPCDDGLFCTDGDACQAGQCEAGPARECGESNDCGSASCDEAAGECAFVPVANGTACTPEDLCLVAANAYCVNGTCAGAPKDCSGTPVQYPECEAVFCDSADGSCDVMPINDGVPCIIGNLCESDKSCDAGVCAGTTIANCTTCNETEGNNNTAAANTGATCVAWGGAIGTVADIDFYRVDVPTAGSRIHAEVTNVDGTGCPTGFASVLRLYDSAGSQIATDSIDGEASCSKLQASDAGANNLPAGTYYLSVEESGNNLTSPPYLLIVNLAAPVCGDGMIQLNEECDDGNATSLDGCSSTCTFDCPAGETLVTRTATGLPLAITDNATITKDVGVASTATVTLVTVVVDILHTYDGDLDLSLDAPNAPAIDLSSSNGGGNDNYQLTAFSSTATTLVTSGSAPYNGWFKPEGDFNMVLGTAANGTWRLTVTDHAGGDIGELRTYRLALCTSP